MENGRVTLTCATCKKQFTTYRSRLGRRKYCSRLCKWTVRMHNEQVVTEFWARVEPPTGPLQCWEWPYKPLRKDGRKTYPHVKWVGRWNKVGSSFGIGTHKASYLLSRGQFTMPKGMWVLHHCDNPWCVRPDHLYLGTAADNARDRELRWKGNRYRPSARATTCRRGHPFSEENTYKQTRGQYTIRICKVCRRISGKRHYLKSRQQPSQEQG